MSFEVFDRGEAQRHRNVGFDVPQSHSINFDRMYGHQAGSGSPGQDVKNTIGHEGVFTPAFSGRAENSHESTAHPEQLPKHPVSQSQPLLQLNFDKKNNKTISPYFQRQVDFLSKPPRTLNENMGSQASLVMNRSQLAHLAVENAASAKTGLMPSQREPSLNWLLGQQTQSLSHDPTPSQVTLTGAAHPHQPATAHLPPELTDSDLKQLQKTLKTSSKIRTTTGKHASSSSLNKRTVSNMKKYI